MTSLKCNPPSIGRVFQNIFLCGFAVNSKPLFLMLFFAPALLLNGCDGDWLNVTKEGEPSSKWWIPQERFLETEEGRDAVVRFRKEFPDFPGSNMYYTLSEHTDKVTGQQIWAGIAHFAYPSHTRKGKLDYRRVFRLRFEDGVLSFAEEFKKGFFVDTVE